MRVWNLGPWSHKYYLSSKSKTHVLIQVHAHKWEVRSQVTTFLSTCLAFSGDTKQELPFPSSRGKILPPSCQKSFQSLLPNLPASRESKHISKRELTQHLKLIKEVPQGPTEPRGASTSKQKPQPEPQCVLENRLSRAAWEARLDRRSTLGKAVAKRAHPLVKCMKGKSLTARQYKDRKGRKKGGKEGAQWEIWKRGRKGEGKIALPLKQNYSKYYLPRF